MDMCQIIRNEIIPHSVVRSTLADLVLISCTHLGNNKSIKGTMIAACVGRCLLYDDTERTHRRRDASLNTEPVV